MAAGAPVVASDLPAFAGRARRRAHRRPVRDRVAAEALAQAVLGLLADPERRRGAARRGLDRARVFDWGVVADRVMAVYETVIAGADGEPEEPPARPVGPAGARRARGGGN